MPLVGGGGGVCAARQSWSPIETATYNFAPSHSLFLNDSNLKLQSHLEKRNIGLGQQANHFSPRVLFPSSCSPSPHLQDCYVGHPLPSVLVPLRPPRRQGGGGKAGRTRAQPQEPRHCYLSGPFVWSGLPLCSRPPLPDSSPVRCRLCQDVPSSIAWCFCGCLRCRTWLPSLLPSVSLCPQKLSPHSCSSRSSLCFTPSGLLLVVSLPGSFWCVFCSMLLCAPQSRVACDAAGPSGCLGPLGKFVTPLPAAAQGPRLLPHPLSVVSLRLPFCWGRGSPALLWI